MVLPHAARCVATAYVCTLMGIPSAMTSGSMPTPLTFTLLAGSRRRGTSYSPLKVRPGRIGLREAESPSSPWPPSLTAFHSRPLSVRTTTQPRCFHFALAF